MKQLEMPDRPQYYGDDHLWIILAVTIIKVETGDTDFLDEVIPYYEKDRDGNPEDRGTVMDHLKRAINFTKNDKGMSMVCHIWALLTGMIRLT